MPCALDKASIARRLGPGLAALLSFHARRVYGRSLEELGSEELKRLIVEVLGERAGPVLRVLDGFLGFGPGGHSGGALSRLVVYA